MCLSLLDASPPPPINHGSSGWAIGFFFCHRKSLDGARWRQGANTHSLIDSFIDRFIRKHDKQARIGHISPPRFPFGRPHSSPSAEAVNGWLSVLLYGFSESTRLGPLDKSGDRLADSLPLLLPFLWASALRNANAAAPSIIRRPYRRERASERAEFEIPLNQRPVVTYVADGVRE